MIFLKDLTKITDTKYSIGFIHYQPFDTKNGLNMTQEELESIGILVDSLPDPQPPVGKIVSGMFIDPTTKIISYEYETPPISPDDKITGLESQVANMQASFLAAQDAINSLLGV